MSSPPLESSLRRHDTSHALTKKSPSRKRHLHSSKDLAHLFEDLKSYDDHYRRKQLKKGLDNIKKFYVHETKYLERYGKLDVSSIDLFRAIEVIEVIKNSLKGPAAFETNVIEHIALSKAEMLPIELNTLQARLLHIDPEESAHFSKLRCKLEKQQHHVFRKVDKEMLTFLLKNAKTMHDLYLLIHSFQIGKNLKEDLLPFLKKKHHRDLSPLAMPTPSIDSKPSYEALRLFKSFEIDHVVGRVKINATKYDCGGETLKDTLRLFIENLYREGWNGEGAEAEASALLEEKETSALKLMRAATFNASGVSLNHLRTFLNEPLKEKFVVSKIARAALPSIFILNPHHFAIIHRQTFQAQPIDGAPALIFDAYSVITHLNDKWTENLHVKNIQILNSQYNEFIKNCFINFQKGKVTSL